MVEITPQMLIDLLLVMTAFPVAVMIFTGTVYGFVLFLQRVFAPVFEWGVSAFAQLTMIRKLFGRSDSEEEPAEAEAETDEGVLSSGYSPDELEEELNQRENALNQLERKKDRAAKRRLSYLQDAQEASGEKKVRYWYKAKKEKMKEQVFSEFHQRMMKEHMFLSRVDMEGFKRRLEETGDEFGFDIAIEELPEAEMIDAIEEDSGRREDIAETIEEIERALEIDGDAHMEMDFSDIKSDVDKVDSTQGMEDALDQQIEAELENVDTAEVYN